MKPSHLALFSVLLTGACVHAPRPVTFTTQAQPRAAVDRAAAALARQGHPVAAVDRRDTTVLTYWEDTGYRYRETDDLESETNIFLRFHVAIRPSPTGSEVTISAESQRCVPGGAVVTRDEVKSTCVKMNRLITSHQRAVDDLGRTLAASIAGSG